MEYVDWFNHRRLHSQITDDPSYVTPTEHETNYYDQTVTDQRPVTLQTK